MSKKDKQTTKERKRIATKQARGNAVDDVPITSDNEGAGDMPHTHSSDTWKDAQTISPEREATSNDSMSGGLTNDLCAMLNTFQESMMKVNNTMFSKLSDKLDDGMQKLDGRVAASEKVQEKFRHAINSQLDTLRNERYREGANYATDEEMSSDEDEEEEIHPSPHDAGKPVETRHSSTLETPHSSTASSASPAQAAAPAVASTVHYAGSVSNVLKDYMSEEFGDPVNDALANMMTDCLKIRLDDDLLEKRKKIWLRPTNIPTLVVPTINKELWNHPQTKGWAHIADNRSQVTQCLLVKGMIPIVKATDKLMKLGGTITHEQVNECVSIQLQGLQLLCCCAADMNDRRKDQFRQTLPYRFRKLCDHSNEVTTFLFGDDVPSAIEAINKTNRIYGGEPREDRSDFRHGKAQKKGGRSFPKGQHKSSKNGGGKQMRSSSWKSRKGPYSKPAAAAPKK